MIKIPDTLVCRSQLYEGFQTPCIDHLWNSRLSKLHVLQSTGENKVLWYEYQYMPLLWQAKTNIAIMCI